MGIFDIFGKKNKDEKTINDLNNAFKKAFTRFQFREAIIYGEKLAQIYRSTGNRIDESACYITLSVTYYYLGDFNKAFELSEKALKISKEIGDKTGESKCYTNLGAFYYSLGDFNKTIEYQKKSLKIIEDVGDRAEESDCYINLGAAYCALGDFNKSIGYHEKSLGITKETGNISGESKCYTNLGNTYNALGDFNKAIKYYKKSLEIAKEIGDIAVESKCYTNLGSAHLNLGDFNKAIKYHEKSLVIVKKIGDIAVESACYTNLGNAYDALGDFNKAIKYHEKSLEIAKEIGDIAVESKCYGNLGNAYDALGDFNKAIKYHEKSLEITKEISDKAGEYKSYGNLGGIYGALGDFNRAIKYYEKSLEIAKEIGDKAGECNIYSNLGGIYGVLRDFNKAIKYYEKSLEIAKEIGDKECESMCYAGLGATYDGLWDYNKAFIFLEKSLKIAKEIGDKAMESRCYMCLGSAHRLIDLRKAIKYHEKALKISRGIGDREGESVICGNLASIYYNKEEYQKSLDCAIKSIKLTEQIRELLINEDLSLKFLRTKFNAYDLAINSATNLYKKTDDECYLKDALEIVEKTKSKELMKIIKAKKKDPKAEKEYKELEAVEIKIRELEIKVKNAVEGKRSVEREVKEKNDLYKRKSELYRKIREKSLDPSSIVPSIDEDIVKEFWGVFEKYSDNCSVLQIYEQKERISYILFDKENFEFFEKKVSEEKIKELVNPLKSMRSSPIFTDTFYGFLKYVLDSILPEILKERLCNLKTEDLFIIPHKHLHQIPWEAMVVDKKPLCVKYNLIRHYSLDLIRSSLKYEEKENKNTLLVSNPKPSKMDDLQGAEIECNTINEVLAELSYNPTHLSRESAKIEDVENQLLDVSIVHFSCHGLFNPKDPLESSIVLSSDNKLSANRISLMNLDYYPLVFLNACETGITKSYELTAGVGDEQIGLVRAFAMAHSPSIIVTGWEIDANVAKYFGIKFYSAISDNNFISALRFAREKTYDKFKDESKDWAAYVLYGNPYRRL